MKGKFYAIQKGITTPEIEEKINIQKYGAVLHLTNHSVYDRIIEAKQITHPAAILLTTQQKDDLIKNFIPKELD